ncbi:hypothetical protein DXX92_13505 [Thalassotalea euphylliae]|uniref:Uncharacterized protein n=2 Tax=Thalassotalea euphylliae TaxID=1655234 RepID=A0A3E0UI10_9GAMM|nr:hypothetical protein DXX92_13505 [Thalassotalea euphylliae]
MITSLLLFGFYYTSTVIGHELIAFALLASALMTIAFVNTVKSLAYFNREHTNALGLNSKLPNNMLSDK